MLSPWEVVKKYGVAAKTIEPLAGGIIHGTWTVHSADETFILQRVSPIFSPVVMDDIAAVLAHLDEKGFVVPKVIATVDGRSYVSDDNVFWRLYSYIPGRVIATVGDEVVAESAGRLLGQYHLALNSFNYQFQHVRSIKHNIPEIFLAYQSATNGKLSDELRELGKAIDALPTMAPPPSLRRHTTHGDPKITNFIFSQTGDEAIAMIDYDDCGNQYNATIEIANAFRSWCQIADEAPNNYFSLDIFEAGLRGYVQGAPDFLQKEEWDWLSTAVKLLPLELASRFLRDVFEDRYFSWDATQFATRKEHNIARAKAQVALYLDVLTKEGEIRAIIRRVAVG